MLLNLILLDLICFKKLLSSFSEINYNVGCLIIICIIAFHIFSAFLFYFNQLKNFKKMIKSITLGLKNINIIKKVNKKIKIANKKEKHGKMDKSNSAKNSKIMIISFYIIIIII